jgi:hypothetical protein
MELVFDEKGNLKPHKAIEIDIQTFESVFATNPLRKDLYDKYLNYLLDLKKVIGQDAHFYQWLNGSYVTKNERPKDIDLVTFVGFPIYESLITKNDSLKSPYSESIYGLDCYFVKIYPENHKQHFEYLADRAYWADWFSKTNPKHHRNKLTFPKGYIEIKF